MHQIKFVICTICNAKHNIVYCYGNHVGQSVETLQAGLRAYSLLHLAWFGTPAADRAAHLGTFPRRGRDREESTTTTRVVVLTGEEVNLLMSVTRSRCEDEFFDRTHWRSSSICSLVRSFDFITKRDDNPVSHNHVDGNIIRA